MPQPVDSHDHAEGTCPICGGPNRDHLSIRETAAILGCSADDVMELIRTGQLQLAPDPDAQEAPPTHDC